MLYTEILNVFAEQVGVSQTKQRSDGIAEGVDEGAEAPGETETEQRDEEGVEDEGRPHIVESLSLGLSRGGGEGKHGNGLPLPVERLSVRGRDGRFDRGAELLPEDGIIRRT